jgi:hypothetical protein
LKQKFLTRTKVQAGKKIKKKKKENVSGSVCKCHSENEGNK